MKSFECIGIWWIPTNPANKVPGTLTFSHEDGLRLQLIGSLDVIEGERWVSDLSRYPFVLGFTKDGQQVTLCDCSTPSLFNIPGLQADKVHANAAYIGAHFSDTQQIKFAKGHIKYNRLGHWFTTSGFKGQYHYDGDGAFNRFELSYTFPDVVSVELPNGTLSINFSFFTPPGIHTVNLSEEIFLSIETVDAIAVSDWLRTCITPMQNFLTLATDHPTAIEDVTTFLPFSDDKSDKEKRVEHIFQPLYIETELIEPLDTEDMLFSYRDIRERFVSILQKWFQISNDLSDVCNLFFGSRYRQSIYNVPRFLAVAQAAEIYHRIRFKNELIPKSEHKQRINTISKITPKELRTWLKENLAYSNEPRLLQRMTDLSNMCEDILVPLVTDKQRFARMITDTRHYYTHYNPRLIEKAAHTIDLVWLTKTLSLVVQRCFLHELGFSSEECIKLFQRNREYQSVLYYGNKF